MKNKLLTVFSYMLKKIPKAVYVFFAIVIFVFIVKWSLKTDVKEPEKQKVEQVYTYQELKKRMLFNTDASSNANAGICFVLIEYHFQNELHSLVLSADSLIGIFSTKNTEIVYANINSETTGLANKLLQEIEKVASTKQNEPSGLSFIRKNVLKISVNYCDGEMRNFEINAKNYLRPEFNLLLSTFIELVYFTNNTNIVVEKLFVKE